MKLIITEGFLLTTWQGLQLMTQIAIGKLLGEEQGHPQVLFWRQTIFTA
ncbi:hypothetical protein [Nitrincola sp. A-D6]|nr:hypothetical protein [Nitrincola sp. A-D6]